ncbi:MAG: hypothetical protein LLF89_06925 [Spirochaetaceae bacterium]|nr:hypothetical protein [Spirochaetaceae bacterium]
MTVSNRRRAGRPARRILDTLVFWCLFSIATACPAFADATKGAAQGAFLVGTERGLYQALPGQGASPDQSGFSFRKLWDQGEVRAIVPAPYGWFFITSKGILFSSDLSVFENRSLGLPTRTLVSVSQEGIMPRREALEIKALAVDPGRQGRIAACTASEVFLSENRGLSWVSLGSPSASPGIKALAFAPLRSADMALDYSANGTASSDATADKGHSSVKSASWALWLSHSIKGVFTRTFDEAAASTAGSTSSSEAKGAPSSNGQSGWVAQSAKLPHVFGSNVQEVSGFALFPGQSGSPGAPSEPVLLAGLSFLGRFYRFDQASRSFVEVYSDGGDFGIAESLQHAAGNVGYCMGRGLVHSFSFDPKSGKASLIASEALTTLLKNAMAAAAVADSGLAGQVLCAGFPEGSLKEANNSFSLNELWLLQEQDPAAGSLATEAIDAGLSEKKARSELANGKNCIYLQTGFVVDPQSREKYFDLMAQLGINGLVIDMKDDEGRLRFDPESEMLREMGSAGDTLDLEAFALEAKARGIYLIARIVVFKDASLYRWNGGMLAVRNKTTGSTWQGTKADGSPIQELWVDPYASDVWTYNVEIAKEVVGRGFDEIQFDYIRFPTDGENIGVIDFPHKLPGMTQETALESFLRCARQAIAAPISIDIYGSNGWYRSGSRTGQDVEMLSNYVDVICPMLYPSHFEQDFLAYAPPEMRPYRIYRIGTLRNQAIARNKVLIRPYVQAFYLNVSYDQAYYGIEYVQKEIRGVKDGANQGMIFWNNSGRYTDLLPLE